MIPFTKLDMCGLVFGCFGTGCAIGYCMAWAMILFALKLG